jgi:xanthine dehydrogenase YagS FAD-binding subunit
VRPFTYQRAGDPLEAVQAAAETPGARFIAGGTNLLDLMKLDIERPTHLIDVSRLPLSTIAEEGENLRIGATTLLVTVAADERIRGLYPVLAQAIVSGGSPQLRNKATVAGNLLQRTRCAYFYDTSKPCNKREPGAGCAALEGLNRNAAIFGQSKACVATHTSDMAVALLALDAQIEVLAPSGVVRRFALDELHLLPGDTPHIETNLTPGELITSVILPRPAPGGQVYRKARDRASFAGGLASVAVAGGKIAFGMVAHKPWRAEAATQALAAGAMPPEAVGREMEAATGLGRNDFKIPLLTRMTMAALGDARRAA